MKSKHLILQEILHGLSLIICAFRSSKVPTFCHYSLFLTEPLESPLTFKSKGITKTVPRIKSTCLVISVPPPLPHKKEGRNDKEEIN